MSRVLVLVHVLVLGCGARTSLEIDPPPPDAGPDAPACMPRVETCNGRDDDCDGRSDETAPLVALGPPIVLRTDAELDAGDCTSCFWAWSPILWPSTDGGWRSIFRISIYGGREEPNLFVRTLDARGIPTGPNTSAGPEVALDLRALDHAPPGRRAIAACWRIGSDDITGLVLASSDGTLERHVYDGYCYDLELAGDRAVTVLASDHRAEMRSRRLDGTDRRERVLELDEVYLSTIASDGARIGVILLRIEADVRQLWFMVLSPLGETLVAPHPLDLPYESYPRLVGTREGWMVVMPGPDRGPARHALLSPDGDVIEPLAPFDDAHVLGDSDLSDDFVPHPDGGTIAHVFSFWDGTTPATMSVRILDERGRTLRSFDDVAPGNGAVATPSVTYADDGRIFVAWHDIAADSTRNFVFVRELGCPP